MFRFIEKRFFSRICKLICDENTFFLNTQSNKHVTAIYYHYYLHIEIISNDIDEKKNITYIVINSNSLETT